MSECDWGKKRTLEILAWEECLGAGEMPGARRAQPALRTPPHPWGQGGREWHSALGWGWRGEEAGRVSAGAQTDRNLTAWECAPGTSGWLYHQVPEQRRRWWLEGSGQLEKSAAILGVRPHHPLPREQGQTGSEAWGRVSAGKEREGT